MFKKHYELFLSANLNKQHYAAHSHHYWPDITRHAMIQYWDDSAKYTDDKWNYFFENKIPATQILIAEVLNLSKPKQIVFAPNTHEFVTRLLSCLDIKNEVSILTTDSEFYSFDRQINRMAESKNITINKISTNDFESFEARFIESINSNKHDLIFFSHVFFNSGFKIKNLKAIVDAVKNSETIIVIDGYHGFMAVPTDLKEIEHRIFYISGSYKYAGAGEGCCFMHVPINCNLRPVNTGWFAGFNELTDKKNEVSYANDGFRFAGSTMDYSALYRLLAVLQLFKSENISSNIIHSYVLKLQNNFRNYLDDINHPVINNKNILLVDANNHGHFFAFETFNNNLTKTTYEELKAKDIITDFRGSRLRFGFGIYQEECINLKYV